MTKSNSREVARTLSDTNAHYQEIIRDNLNVKNAALLKTGTLGTLVNIFSNIKQDNKIFSNNLIRELNPATCNTFDSVLFHSSILNYNIEFSQPARGSVQFIIPEVNIRDSEVLTYYINKDTVFIDENGMSANMLTDIQIVATSNSLSAQSYGRVIEELDVQRVKNPLNTTLYMYLITYNDMVQYERKFDTYVIPDSVQVGTKHIFSIDIPNRNDIYKINVYKYKHDIDNTYDIDYHSSMLMNSVSKYSSDDIAYALNVDNIDIEYYKYGTSQFKEVVFTTLNENSIEVEFGDGVNGKLPTPGDIYIFEVKITKGNKGNVSSAEYNLEDIDVVSKDVNGYTNRYQTNIKAISSLGYHGGKDIKNISDLRKDMIDQSTIRKSLVSINDFELAFTHEGIKPFVDTKFFNSKNHLFIYGAIRDQYDNIIYTNTFNIEENEFLENLFFPRKTYQGVDLISPFYYKRYSNHYKSYLVIPDVIIDIHSLYDDEITKTYNKFGLHIKYDYSLQETRFEISNFDPTHTYKVYTNLFSIELSVHNGFKQKINQRFLDEFCLITEDINDVIVDVFDNKDTLIIQYQSKFTYSQLKEKQSHFYYNVLNSIDLNREDKYILQIPFIDDNYFKKTEANRLFTKIDNFFHISENEQEHAFNIEATQAFYNTIFLEPKYGQFIVNENNNGSLLNVKNNILVHLVLDKYKYRLSGYKSQSKLEFDIKSLLIKMLRKKEGFKIEYFETAVESLLIDNFDMIKNVDVISPKMFTTNDTNTIYDKMDTKIGVDEADGGITRFDIIDFIPPYFYYDYANIAIKLVFIN
jgi:hypothetical protein